MQLQPGQVSHKIPGPNLPEHYTRVQSSPEVKRIPQRGLALLRGFVVLKTMEKTLQNKFRSDPACIKVSDSENLPSISPKLTSKKTDQKKLFHEGQILLEGLLGNSPLVMLFPPLHFTVRP